jgi:hypothetical protein
MEGGKKGKPKGKGGKANGKLDFYDVLELPLRHEATPDQVKSAYKKLALVSALSP